MKLKSKSNGKKPGDDAPTGSIRLKLKPAAYYKEMIHFYGILETLDDLKIVSHQWSETSLDVLVSLNNVIPVDEILKKIPMVVGVHAEKEYTTVVLNHYSPDTVLPS